MNFAGGSKKKALWRRLKAEGQRAKAKITGLPRRPKSAKSVPIQHTSATTALVANKPPVVVSAPIPQPVNLSGNHVGASLAMALFLGGSSLMAVLPEMPAAKALFGGRAASKQAASDKDGGLVTASLGGGDAGTLLLDALNPSVADDLTRVEAMPETRTLTVHSGDTLSEMLTDAGATALEAHNAVSALKTHFDPRKIRSGQEIQVTLAPPPTQDAPTAPASLRTAETDDDDGLPHLLSVSLEVNNITHVTLDRSEDGNYTASVIETPLTEKAFHAVASIDSSLFLSAEAVGIPHSIIVELIRMYSYDVDFQRDIQKGDNFELLFTQMMDDEGHALREGHIEFAALTTGGKTRKLWRFDPKDGEPDYFDEKGQSGKKFLMRTPVDGARISSGFGMRMHPILGYSKMHKGIDFAAPRGTPVMAAGSGTIEYASRYGSYGNYVRIRHANGYKTAYAHLNGFGRGIKKGMKVTQGEIIGYVGTTGRSTGPHLHYEVLQNDHPVNPMGVKVPTGTFLAGADLKDFKTQQVAVQTEMATAAQMGHLTTAGLVADTSDTSRE